MDSFCGTAVVITTLHRGVFFGYLEGINGDDVIATKVRICISWCDTKGFIGLATHGPNIKCRIGPAASRVLLKNVTAIIAVDPEAVIAWETAPWAK